MRKDYSFKHKTGCGPKSRGALEKHFDDWDPFSRGVFSKAERKIPKQHSSQ